MHIIVSVVIAPVVWSETEKNRSICVEKEIILFEVKIRPLLGVPIPF